MPVLYTYLHSRTNKSLSRVCQDQAQQTHRAERASRIIHGMLPNSVLNGTAEQQSHSQRTNFGRSLFKVNFELGAT